MRQLGIEQRVVDIAGDKWVLTGDLLVRIRLSADGTEVLPVDAFVMRRFQKEQQRRLANLQIAANLECKDPALTGDPVLHRWKSEWQPLTTQWVREGVELPVRVRVADPDFAKSRIAFEKAHGFRTSENIYGYERAFAAAPVWPSNAGVVLDATAGGGSIPFEAMRLGYSVIANELNPVATAILYGTLDFPARFGSSLAEQICNYGNLLISRMHARSEEFFPTDIIPNAEQVILGRSLATNPELVEKYLDERTDALLSAGDLSTLRR